MADGIDLQSRGKGKTRAIYATCSSPDSIQQFAKTDLPTCKRHAKTSVDCGEGVNHAIVDAFQLADTIKVAADGHVPVQDAVKEYERQMCPRAREAVESSRQAGLDGHCYAKVDKEGSFALLGEKPE